MEALAALLMGVGGIIGFTLLIAILRSFRVLNEYERGVIFRLGKFSAVKGPGLIILIPILDRMTKVSLRIIALDVPGQDIITKDNVSVKVNAV
ncbi:MAG: SPFH domain-containing protein, partial [Ignavibacteria bacterium]